MVPHLDTPTPLDSLPEFFSSVHAHTSHVTQPPNFPVVLPPEFEAREYSYVSAQWNPSVHLQMEVSEYVVDVDFKKNPITSLSEKNASDSFPGLAFTTSFRLLSLEGVKVSTLPR